MSNALLETKNSELPKNINVKFLDDLIKGEYNAVTHVSENKCIILPSNPTNDSAFVYDIERKMKLNNVTIKREPIIIGKITYSTNIEPDNTFWLLNTNCDDKRTTLIKAFYNRFDKIMFMTEYIMPDVLVNNSNFRTLVKVSPNDFMLFSGLKYDSTKNVDYKNTTIFVTIKNHALTAQPICVETVMGGHSFNLEYVRSAFNFEGGIIIMPQIASVYAYPIYNITNQEIKRIKREIKSNQNSLKITANILYSNFINDISDYDHFISTIGIEALTNYVSTQGVNKIYGISTWVRPYYTVKNEVAPPGQEYVQQIESDSLPTNYDRSQAGVYMKPVVGTLLETSSIV